MQVWYWPTYAWMSYTEILIVKPWNISLRTMKPLNVKMSTHSSYICHYVDSEDRVLESFYLSLLKERIKITIVELVCSAKLNRCNHERVLFVTNYIIHLLIWPKIACDKPGAVFNFTWYRWQRWLLSTHHTNDDPVDGNARWNFKTLNSATAYLNTLWPIYALL